MKVYKTYNHIYNYKKKWNQKNMKECDKQKKPYKQQTLYMIYISSNNVRHPVTQTFTTLHPTTLHSTTLVVISLPPI